MYIELYKAPNKALSCLVQFTRRLQTLAPNYPFPLATSTQEQLFNKHVGILTTLGSKSDLMLTLSLAFPHPPPPEFFLKLPHPFSQGLDDCPHTSYLKVWIRHCPPPPPTPTIGPSTRKQNIHPIISPLQMCQDSSHFVHVNINVLRHTTSRPPVV